MPGASALAEPKQWETKESTNTPSSPAPHGLNPFGNDFVVSPTIYPDLSELLRLSQWDGWTKGTPYNYMSCPSLGPWETMKKGVDKFDDELSRVWKDDLDTLLVFVRNTFVFAGLHTELQ